MIIMKLWYQSRRTHTRDSRRSLLDDYKVVETRGSIAKTSIVQMQGISIRNMVRNVNI